MALPPSLPPPYANMNSFAPLPPQQAPPVAPTLLNLNQRYNMSANSLTEALLLLSGMYISLVQPDPGPVKIGLHAIFPSTSGPFTSAVGDPFTSRNKGRTFMNYPAVPQAFDISTSYSRSDYAPKDLLDMLCKEVFPQNTISILYMNNHLVMQKYMPPIGDYLPRIIESLGLPIISYDTQFSVNARPKLSVQLAPTMGQMMDVMFAFLRKFNWTDFSFLCTLSYGCQDEIAAIRNKVVESHRKPNVSVYGVEMFSYNLLSYVNFTDGQDKEEVREKLKYELDKDTRIILVHGNGAEVKDIMNVAKELGLTGRDYVWIYTISSLSLSGENSIVSDSYPLGSFVIGFDSRREDMTDVVKTCINLWLDALNSLASSPEVANIDFETQFSCDRMKEDMNQNGNQSSKSPLFWKYGEMLYQHILKSKLPGEFEFDKYGVLKRNKFWIMNVQYKGENLLGDSRSGGRSPIRGRPRPSGGFLANRGSRYRGQSSSDRTSGSHSRGRGRTVRPPLSRDRSSSSVSSRNRTSGSLFSRDRNSGSPFSRDRRPGPLSSRGRDSGSPLSRGRDSRNRTSSPLFSRGRDTPRSRDRASSFSRDHDTSSASPVSSDPASLSLTSSSSTQKTTASTNEETPEDFELKTTPPASPSSTSSWMSDRVSSRSKSSGSERKLRRTSRGRIRHGDDDKPRRHRGFGKDGSEEMDERKDDRVMRGANRRRRALGKTQIAKKIAEWNGYNLSITGITWPGGSSKPPKGKPEKYVLKVVTWKEDPHVIYTEMDNETALGEDLCDANSLACKVYPRDKHLHRLGNQTKDMCCTGLTIDLLKRLSEVLHFDVQLSEVPDGSYGSPLNKNLTEWNGMLGMLIDQKADMAMGALSITPERSAAVDFSVPFLQTGITIIVAIREGAISPTAFLEPYDYPSWSLILVFSVHATGASIFIFEWLSPYGLDQGKTPLSVHKFSLFRSFWLIWAMLFGASVSTDVPRGCASRFLANIWALFAVVFCASYTANLAAFMITKDDFYDLSGIQDWRLKNPHHRQPPFKFATIANSSTDLNIEKNYKEIHEYMKTSAQTDVKDAIRALKQQEIQAFIYDSTTLEYEVGKDKDCKLKNVGKRIAETGYGVAFPKKSQWVKQVDRALLQMQEDGEIERLQRFWLAGACHKKKETGVSSHTLGILNFTSAFILLGGGVILGVLLLLLEHMYFRFGRKSLKKWDKCGCCSLVSLSMGQSLTFEQSVMEAIDYHRQHKCKDPLCETQLWKVKHELDIALLKISQLRKQLAHTASLEAEKGAENDIMLTSDDTDLPTHQNGSARRRRRQDKSDNARPGSDSSTHKPLLFDSKNDTDDDDSLLNSPKRPITPSSPSRMSFPSAKNKIAARDADIPLQNVRKSLPNTSDDFWGQEPNGRPASRMTKLQGDSPGHKGEKKSLGDLDLHTPPPTFDEAMVRPGDSSYFNPATSSPSPPLPPPPPTPPPAALEAGLDPAAQGYPDQHLSESNASNLPSSDDKRYEPFILDSPDSPSSSSPFSESTDNRLPSPGALSKLSDEGTSTPASPSRDSDITSSPDIPTSVADGQSSPLPTEGLGNQYQNNAQTIPSTSSSDKPARPHERVKPGHEDVPLTPSKEDDNDVRARRPRDNDGNVYVNVDDIIGKETTF